MKGRFGDAEHGHELFHRHFESGLQIVQLLHRQANLENFDQLGSGKIGGGNLAAWSVDTIADHTATNFLDAPLAAFLADDHHARGFLRQLLGQWFIHLILFLVSHETVVNAHFGPFAGNSRREDRTCTELSSQPLSAVERSDPPVAGHCGLSSPRIEGTFWDPRAGFQWSWMSSKSRVTSWIEIRMCLPFDPDWP